MGQSMIQVKKLHQKTLSTLVAAYVLAMESGYSLSESKALAVGACERLRQGGMYDFAAKIKAIRSHTAKIGTHTAATYDRLTKGRAHHETIKDQDGTLYRVDTKTFFTGISRYYGSN